jgi:pantoate--beta-alanine ligase
MRETLLQGYPVAAVEADARSSLEAAGLVPDYAVVRRADDLGDAVSEQGGRVALIAARMGGTRLIDNLLIDA